MRELSTIERQTAGHKSRIFADYLQKLNAFEKRLTQGGHLEKALAVRKEKDNAEKLVNSDNQTLTEEGASSLRSTASPAATRVMSIPDDAVVFNGHSYKILDIPPRDWREAKAVCERKGGSLATAETEDEMEFLGNMAPELHLWIGGYVEGTEENPSTDFMWVNGIEIGDFIHDHGNIRKPRTVPAYLRLYREKVAACENPTSGFIDGFICEWEGVKE